jgi:hypothetical protein
VEDRQHNLWDNMLRRDKVNIVHIAHILQFNVPFRKLFGCEVEAVALMGDVMVLTEDAAKIAAGEEDGA